MTVAGTSVTVEDTQAGGALVFVTTGDAEALRARVRAWADAHNARHGAMGALPTGEETAADGGGEHHHHHGGGDEGGGGEHAGHEGHAAAAGEPMSISVHSRATASDIDGGARLEWITFPGQVGFLRDELRAHAEHLAMGHCAMPAGS